MTVFSSRILLHVLAATLVLALAIGDATGAEPATISALRAKYPKGIPWTVEISDSKGQPLGSLGILITSTEASSCLGGMDPGVRVEFTQKEHVPPNLPITSYGVAKFGDNTIKIDLTGGLCDAYSIMEGKIDADGSSTGDVFRFGMRLSDEIGTYRATVK